jgi:hypothetical protein
VESRSSERRYKNAESDAQQGITIRVVIEKKIHWIILERPDLIGKIKEARPRETDVQLLREDGIQLFNMDHLAANHNRQNDNYH